MTVEILDDHIKKAFDNLGFSNEDVQKGCWLLKRNEKPVAWICLHKFLERVAQVAGIIFDEPKILNLNDKEIALWVNGHKGDFSAWAIGEVSPANCKNAYRWAMAEKRAKDRVILKLLGIAGDTYSEEEADDFKKAPQNEDLKKEAIAWKTATTKAVRQAIAKGEEFTPLDHKKSLEERCHDVLAMLNDQTPTTFINLSKSEKDYVNDLLRELHGLNRHDLLEPLMEAYNNATSIDDSIPD